MSTTECTTITSRVPTRGPNRRFPEAMGVTMILGTPIGQAQHGAGAEHRALRAPERQHAIEPALAEQVEREPLQPEQHAVHRFSAAPRLAQRLDGLPAQPRDLRPRHVGDDVERPGEDAGIGDDGADAERLQAVAHVGDLGPLRVQRANEKDRLHG